MNFSTASLIVFAFTILLVESAPGAQPGAGSEMFGSDWSSGLVSFEIRGLNNGTWAADNLVMSVPEPSVGAISALGALLCCCRWLKRRKHVSVRQPTA